VVVGCETASRALLAMSGPSVRCDGGTEAARGLDQTRREAPAADIGEPGKYRGLRVKPRCAA